LTRAILDSSVIIALSQLKHLQTLDKLFTEIIVPEAVYNEVCIKGNELTGSSELFDAIKLQKIKVMRPENQELVKALLDPLGGGEAEAIALASSLIPDYLVMDDRLARRKAQNMGFNVIGTLRVLRLMYNKKLLSYENLIESINALETMGFHISEKIIQELIKSLDKQ